MRYGFGVDLGGTTVKIAYFDDAETMFKSGLIDIAMIETPHYDHPAIAMDAMENGLHVMCEKPMAINAEEAKKIIDMLGADKFFFATDFPMWDSKTELERFNSIPLSDSEREMIFSKNIKKLLKICRTPVMQK